MPMGNADRRFKEIFAFTAEFDQGFPFIMKLLLGNRLNIRFCLKQNLSYGEDVGTTQVLQVQSELLSSFDGRTETRKTWKFCFDRVFTESASQSEVFDEGLRELGEPSLYSLVAGLIQSALDGKNCCIFAYGQTGSGKTYTMLGDLQCENKRGIIPRSIDFLFEQKETLKDYYSQELNFSVSFLEIYNDKLQDLLHKSGGVKPKYSIRHRCVSFS